MRKTLEERFWQRVRKDKSCWNWIGSKNKKGYGQMFVYDGPSLTHRVSWILHHKGPIPKGKWVLHQCDNPACINPDHLFLGDHVENMRDAAFKGRINLGENNAAAKLTWGQVDQIRLRYFQLLTNLETEFGVARRHIKDILSERRWVRKGNHHG